MTSELLTGVDAAWLHMDRPENTADVVAVLSFAGGLTLSELRDVIARKLLVHARFKQRVVHRGPLGTPSWEDDPRFDLRHHVIRGRIGKGPDALQRFASAVSTEPLDPDRPLWRAALVDRPGGGTAVVLKIHHCVADGFALVAVLLGLVDDPPAEPARPHAPPALRAFPLVEDPVAALRSALTSPVRALEVLAGGGIFATTLARLSALAPDRTRPLRVRLTGERRVAWSRPLPLAEIRAASRARGATVNDLLLAALAGALRGWVNGGAGGRDVRAIVPVNLRPLGGPAALGNAFGLVFLDLPMAPATHERRLEALRERMDALKHRPDACVTFGVLGILGKIPAALERLVNAFFTSKATLVVTNVPGPRKPLHLAGHLLDDVMFWVPHPSDLGLGVSILSYAGAVRVGIRADVAVTAAPRDLVSRFEREVAALCEGFAAPPVEVPVPDARAPAAEARPAAPPIPGVEHLVAPATAGAEHTAVAAPRP